ncbi:oxidoreductase, 2-nitropropane dioxygenase family, putative [Paecilomyces variotii No. 5]|uniref:Oxidoreductase, 2-nitropropane dioxygenase family, putative n=1 Tax=Byssochlamys spectabilis (strain No. 5 / NBRC 109023) TaxID=1356009 RepID=V5FV41_BYSSN|nr:oxidoreductase, 2-nitropropane dioxygenase family, putative [Paecilomyces variotii No. 5]
MGTLQLPLAKVKKDYPWVKFPFIVSAPMARVAKPQLAAEVSRAGGLGFVAAGYTSDTLEDWLEETSEILSDDRRTLFRTTDPTVLPVGVGFITWSASLDAAIGPIQKYRPCAVWLFAPPTGFRDLVPWATKIRAVTSQKTKIWVQVGSLADAVEVAILVQPDVLVMQGSDAGGHSLARGASIVSLVPEVCDKFKELQSELQKTVTILASGGICDGRGVAAATNLGAQGCVMGTRFLASPESLIPQGYQREILRASDGGSSTVRTKIYDKVRDIHGWPEPYNGRGLINRTYLDAVEGMDEKKNRELYVKELDKGDEGYGPEGRLTTYAGTAVGLVKEVMPAADIVVSVREQARQLLHKSVPDSRL